MLGQYSPSDSSELVGDRAGHHVRMASCEHRSNPLAKPIGSQRHSLDDGSRTLDQQVTQMLVTSLADSIQNVAASGAVLLGN